MQLKNAVRAKYDEILLPIAMTLIVHEQRKHITFNAFFDNTMFHEIAHGLGLPHHSNSTYIMYGAAQSYDPQTEFQPSYKTYFNGGALPGPNR